MASDLTDIPNVGPAVARRLRQLGIASLDDLRGQDGNELYDRLCELDGTRHDPCLLDTFVAVVDYADGDPPRPWWEYSRERKERAHA
jgi:Pathogenicity locus